MVAQTPKEQIAEEAIELAVAVLRGDLRRNALARDILITYGCDVSTLPEPLQTEMGARMFGIIRGKEETE